VSDTASCEVAAAVGPLSFTVIAERLLLTPWEEATLTLPEMDPVAAWGLESAPRASPGTAQTETESNNAAKTIHGADFALPCIIFNKILPDFARAISALPLFDGIARRMTHRDNLQAWINARHPPTGRMNQK
jgi:hypothetical protein